MQNGLYHEAQHQEAHEDSNDGYDLGCNELGDEIDGCDQDREQKRQLNDASPVDATGRLGCLWLIVGRLRPNEDGAVYIVIHN